MISFTSLRVTTSGGTGLVLLLLVSLKLFSLFSCLSPYGCITIVDSFSSCCLGHRLLLELQKSVARLQCLVVVLLGANLLDSLIVCVVGISIELYCDTTVLSCLLIEYVLVPLECVGVARVAPGVRWCLVADRASGSLGVRPWFDLSCGRYDEGVRLYHGALLGVDVHVLPKFLDGPLGVKETTVILTGTIESRVQLGGCVHKLTGVGVDCWYFEGPANQVCRLDTTGFG